MPRRVEKYDVNRQKKLDVDAESVFGFDQAAVTAPVFIILVVCLFAQAMELVKLTGPNPGHDEVEPNSPWYHSIRFQ